MSDVGEFASVFLGGVYDFRIDFDVDGTMGLGDVGIFALHLGETCP